MKRLKLAIRILLSFGLIALLFTTADLSQLGEILGRGRPLYLLAALLVGFGDRVLMAVKWNLLLRVKGLQISHLRATITYWISTFFGLFLPATIGGDAVRAYAVSREGFEVKEIVSSIIVERLLGFVALFTFVCVSIVLSLAVFGQSFFPGIWRLFWTFGLLLLLSTAALWLSLNATLAGRAAAWIQRILPGAARHQLAGKLGQFYQAYFSYRDKKGTLALFYFLSILESLFPLFWTVFLAVAFHIEVPFLFFFILIPIVLVLVRLPISIDGFGLQEGAFVYFLGLIGVPAEEALLLGLASHALGLLTVLPGGLLYAIGGLRRADASDLQAVREQWLR